MTSTELSRRRTFAIISHPDAGKTTITEKLLLYGGAINLAGEVKGRKAARHAHSDWMELEKSRGISVTTSVMQFIFHDRVFNLLDTPGHEDFSEDTYRTLTAVDSALMVIDVAKGVEERTKKLMQVCRLRDTPIATFINKCDREGLSPIELLDHIEHSLEIACAPVTWPLGMGKSFCGFYHLVQDKYYYFAEKKSDKPLQATIVEGLNNPEIDELIGDLAQHCREEIELLQGASHSFDQALYLKGQQTPVYFGAAINTIGVEALLADMAEFAPGPGAYHTTSRDVQADEEKLTGFVFKVQANMDPNHRDRIAFMRICSGQYQNGIKMLQVRTKKQLNINQALTFLAGDRSHIEAAYPGDIIGLYNHGTIAIGDTFTQGENLQFVGIPYFAPELFRRVVLKDPLKSKALLKGLHQLSEEGATQVFRPLKNNDLILGAVGILQFDVVKFRLKHEYNVDCDYENIAVATARWVDSDQSKILEQFKNKCFEHCALDHHDQLTYLAPSRVNLQLAQERWQDDIQWSATKEH